MAQTAAKQAPARKKETQRAGNTGAPQKQNRQESIHEKLHSLPLAAGAAAMCVLLVLSLFVGNFRALQSATPKAFIRQDDVQSIIEDRIDAAQNVLTIAGRNNLDANAVNAAQSAAEQMEKAKTARDISRADQDLTAAISMLTTDSGVSAQDSTYMQRAADDFAEQGSFLRQEARAYNEEAEKAEKLYEKLPTKFLLPEPDVYEGI